MLDLVNIEITQKIEQLDSIEKEIIHFLLSYDSKDSCGVIIEFRAGVGGNEAGIFAYDLLNMYFLF